MNHKAEGAVAPVTTPGSAPGAPPGARVASLQVISYGPDKVEERVVESAHQIRDLLGKARVTWVNVDGPADQAVLAGLGAVFELHPLALEDVVNPRQRSKVEDYGKYLFIVTRMPVAAERLATEQLSLFFGSNFVLTFQESPGGDCLDAVRNRILRGIGTVRGAGPDHLAYELVDQVTDSYFPVLESLEKRLNILEEKILKGRNDADPMSIHEIKRDLLAVRHTLRPLREAVTFLMREGSALISQETRVYLRDCADHVLRMLDQIETDTVLCSDLMNVHLTSVNNRISEVMKVLTIITTLFIPPAFIASLYGMNFNPEKSPYNMPELNWFFGYPFALGLMALLVGGLLFFLHHKGWLADLFKSRRR